MTYSHLWAAVSPEGMDGYSANRWAWWFQIPSKCLPFLEKENNTLEFLASFFCIWITIIKGDAPPLSCFLSFDDSTSALGWLYHANTNEQTHPLLQIIMRQFARVIMKGEYCLYGQHIKGAFNSVSDVHSRLHDHTDNNLTAYLFSSFPKQVLNTFAIAPLPPCISSLMILFLQKTEEIKESQ